ncbi:hypothetical protein DBR32_14505 [Taibaiella sp. KBW10]|uniref:hypothetical protein n=1 Tax=Taibaiella sp. KBW10 TaxID=2153357 RepID=UPI000F5A50E5|nr:hypothetical protein [Taibaiella sp. KBW10]RQO29792.1 hypothetical protein DBR32_14505 [Taibaiella sp. KBW10]
MRKSILVLSALGMLSMAACKEGGSGKLAQKWQIVPDSKTQDSMFKAQLTSIDTMTAFPAEFEMMKEQMAKMKPEELKQIPAETVEMLKTTNLDSFKMKARASMLEGKKKQDEMEKTRVVVYDFQANGLVKMYATDNLNQVDTSTGWKEDAKKKEILLFMNPSAANGANIPKDTMKFKILHLSGDSLSIKAEGKEVMPNMKPMNFKKFVEPKKTK